MTHYGTKLAGRNSSLLTQAQLSDQGTVTVDVLLCQIVQQVAALTNHLQQATAAVIVMDVGTQMLGELVDAVGEDSNLYLGEPVSPSWVAYWAMT